MKILEKLQNLFNFIKSGLKSLFNKKERNDSQKSIESIKKSLFQTSSLLRDLDEFKEEYLLFLKIKKILVYVLENISSIEDNKIIIIFDSFYDFNDLIKAKINFLDGKLLKLEYNHKYESFVLVLRKTSEFFYVNIYESTGRFDDVIIDIGKVIIDK